MKKLFRYHRGSLADSLATTIEVKGLYELKQILAKKLPYVYNVRIHRTWLSDDRLPEEWNGGCHYVVVDFDGYTGQCIGMCNFYEE